MLNFDMIRYVLSVYNIINLYILSDSFDGNLYFCCLDCFMKQGSRKKGHFGFIVCFLVLNLVMILTSELSAYTWLRDSWKCFLSGI